MSKPKPTSPPATLTAAVRRAIEQSGLTRYEISKRSGLTQASLSRFANGLTCLNLESLDRLAPVLGLKLVAQKTKKEK